MKYKIILSILSLLVVLSFCKLCFAEKISGNKKQNILSGNEIDLLVGTPEGIAEPLDARRNKITKDNQIDYSGFLDENALSDNENLTFNWEDAEDMDPNEKQVESQLMDLLAETEELEKIDEIYYGDEDEEIASDTEKLISNKYEIED